MIRYVHIGDQILEDRDQFAWFDTVIDEFIEFNNETVFNSWDEFQEYLEQTEYWNPLARARFESLFPRPQTKLKED